MVENKKTIYLQTFMNYLSILLTLLIIAYFVVEFFHPVLTSGESMEPTLKNGSLLVTTDIFTQKDLKKGDIVVFKNNDVQLIKRIVATPGDEIWISDGILYVNGEESKYQFDKIENAGLLCDPIYIQTGQYFCMGDNRNISIDCREIGPIKFEQITYKVLTTLNNKE